MYRVMSERRMWLQSLCCFFFNDTATTEIYTLSLHDALPIWQLPPARLERRPERAGRDGIDPDALQRELLCQTLCEVRSEEHTSELQSRQYLVCRLLLEKKKKTQPTQYLPATLRPATPTPHHM